MGSGQILSLPLLIQPHCFKPYSLQASAQTSAVTRPAEVKEHNHKEQGHSHRQNFCWCKIDFMWVPKL